MWRRRLPVLLSLTTLAVACGDGDDDGGASATATAPDGGAPNRSEEPARPAQARGARLKQIGSFASPVYVTAPPRDRHRLFVVEQAGTIRVVRRGRTLPRPFLDIRSQVSAGGERGLLSMAFAPDYRRSRRFYVSYTNTSGDSRIVEYRARTRNRARPSSARLVLAQDQPESNHNGGLILFGPDRRLYVGFGDGGGAGDRHGSRGNAQNLGTWLGKILRINPRRSGDRPYTVPDDNPFVGREGARPEIYAYGLRNPWRFAFHPRNRGLVIADVGQNAVEEVDFALPEQAAGANFGWRPFEGTSRYRSGEDAPGHVPPILERFHDDGWCSITGGIVVRDRRLRLAGRYVFGDYCRPQVISGRLAASRMRAVADTGLRVPSLVSFGEDARRRAYAVSQQGPVYRLVPR